MINQQILQAPENDSSIAGEVETILSILSDRIYSMAEIEKPGILYNLIKNYISRNVISTIEDGKKKMLICKSCIKAYIESLKEEEYLNEKLVSSVSSVLNCAVGHNKYFLDGERVIKV